MHSHTFSNTNTVNIFVSYKPWQFIQYKKKRFVQRLSSDFPYVVVRCCLLYNLHFPWFLFPVKLKKSQRHHGNTGWFRRTDQYFWKVIGSVIVRKKEIIYMYLILNGYRHRAVRTSGPNSVRYLVVRLEEEGSLWKKDGCTRWLTFWTKLPAQRNKKISSDEKHAIFAYELRRSLRLMVGFSKTYNELCHICHFCVTNLSFRL
jgi:hypothetical protein